MTLPYREHVELDYAIRDLIVRQAAEALVARTMGDDHQENMDVILMRATPRYNDDPEHTELWHRLKREAVAVAEPLIEARLKADGRICALPGCTNAIRDADAAKYCSRTCSGLAPKRRAGPVSQEELDEMARLFEQGMALETIGEKIGRVGSTVKRKLCAMGYEMRPRTYREDAA